MRVVKSFRGKEFEIKEGFKLNYPKKTLMDQTQMIERYLRSEKFGTESETANYLEAIKSFSKRNFVAKIYYVEAYKIGRIDFADFEVIVQYYAFKNRKGEWLPFAQNMKLKKYGELAYEFKYTPENIQILQMEMLKNGFDVVVFEKENEQPSIAEAQAQRIRILGLRYKYPQTKESVKTQLSKEQKKRVEDTKKDVVRQLNKQLSYSADLQDNQRIAELQKHIAKLDDMLENGWNNPMNIGLGGNLESAAFFIDTDGDFCISESGLSEFMKEKFGIVTDLNVINNRFLSINITDVGESISAKKFVDLENYFEGLEKRFEISTFVDTNKYQIRIDSVLDIGLYN